MAFNVRACGVLLQSMPRWCSFRFKNFLGLSCRWISFPQTNLKKISLLHIVAAISSTNPIDFAEAPVSQKSASFLRVMHMSKSSAPIWEGKSPDDPNKRSKKLKKPYLFTNINKLHPLPSKSFLQSCRMILRTFRIPARSSAKASCFFSDPKV